MFPMRNSIRGRSPRNMFAYILHYIFSNRLSNIQHHPDKMSNSFCNSSSDRNPNIFSNRLVNILDLLHTHCQHREKIAIWGCGHFLEATFAGSEQREEACRFPTMFGSFKVILRSGFVRHSYPKKDPLKRWKPCQGETSNW